MAELGLIPDPKLLVIQGVIFVGALLSANHFIFRPALRLHNERRRRTSGAVDSAKSEIARAEALEATYNKELKMRTEEVRNLRVAEVLAGQAEADAILAEAQGKAKAHLGRIQGEVEASVSSERAKIPALVDDVVKSILSQMGAATALLMCAALATASNGALAAVGGAVDPWYGIFWPYFQYACYIVALVFLGRKTIASILESRRDTLRTKMSEAKQAVTMAQRRAAEFESKVASLEKEIAELRAQYVGDGVKERSKIITDAQKLAQQMIRDAERAANELIIRSKEDLRRELLDKAIETVETRLTPDRIAQLDRKLKGEVLDGLRGASVH